ncbi:PRC-barrel domain-containing protein [Candidatus Woesearchaeota archaeon]|nr:PRC-barrel domain-containing protein [Candidatus Woesearchaeota archaeon]
MLKTKRVSEIYNMRVFTDDGSYFGDIEECMVSGNRVNGWRIKATKGSALTKVLGGAKGVIIPHQLVKAIGDVVVINRSAIPSYDGEEQE